MFEKNILTFTPGWDRNAQKLASFTDVRDVQRQLKAQGVQLQQEADESTSGPVVFTVDRRDFEIYKVRRGHCNYSIDIVPGAAGRS